MFKIAKMFAAYCFISAQFFVASDSKKLVVPRAHAYNVPNAFENYKRCNKESEELREDGALVVKYRNEDIFCARIFYPNGEITEIYKSHRGIFPSETAIRHCLNGEKRIVNNKDGISILVSKEDLRLAKLTLKNTAKNKSFYKGYPWEVLFAEVEAPNSFSQENYLGRSQSDQDSSSSDSDFSQRDSESPERSSDLSDEL